MIPELVNSAQMEIATAAKKIPAVINCGALTRSEGETREIYNLPDDFYKIMDGGLFNPDGIRIKNYRIVGNKIFFPKGIDENLDLEYWRFPVRLDSDVSDETELDNTADTHLCIPFYVAAHLLLYDDAYRYTALLNEWEKRIARLRSNSFVEGGLIHNCYV